MQDFGGIRNRPPILNCTVVPAVLPLVLDYTTVMDCATVLDCAAVLDYTAVLDCVTLCYKA